MLPSDSSACQLIPSPLSFFRLTKGRLRRRVFLCVDYLPGIGTNKVRRLSLSAHEKGMPNTADEKLRSHNADDFLGFHEHERHSCRRPRVAFTCRTPSPATGRLGHASL